ncbi:MAG: hypothetical protein WEB90_04895 [Gemmatimonadota bacterium]
MTTNGAQGRVCVAVSIDTEEDNWGSYAQAGETTRNIAHLIELQDLFDRRGARPIYLVNRAPLLERAAVDVLGRVAARAGVEIGAHCHPWNTPPFTGASAERSMMAGLSDAENRGKIQEVGARMHSELGVRPRVFRAGRWGFGPSVARALVQEGYAIDTSVTPFMDWRNAGGPDYGDAPNEPYRFDPEAPLVPAPSGALVELPTTVGFLGDRDFRRAARMRRDLEAGRLTRKFVGPFDRLGFFAKRWLSPENSTADTMIRLAESCVAVGQEYLQVTFHSSALLPGATPFVRTQDDRTEFLRRLDGFLAHCVASGYIFLTLSEIEARLFAR